MKRLTVALFASALAAGATFSSAGTATASPLAPAAANAGAPADSPVIPVSSSGRRLTAGIIGGLLLGGIVASQWPYHYGYYPYAAYPGYAPYPVYGGYPVDPAIAYCIRRFKSYDVYSRTYLGYDGRRHYCP